MKNISISIALILSVLGLGALAGTFWLGLVLSHTDVLVALFYAVGLFLVGLVASLLAIHAKRTRPDFRKWRIIEIVSVAVMLLISAWMFFDGSVTGFNFLFDSKTLSEKARNDVDALTTQVDDFRVHEHLALDRTVSGLESLLGSHAYDYSNAPPQVINFIRYKVMNGLEPITSFSSNKIEDYQAKMQLLIENLSTSETGTTGASIDILLATYGSDVASWSPATIASFADQFNDSSLQIAVNLQSLASNLEFPIIKSQGGYFVLETPAPITCTPVQSTFAQSFTDIFSFNNSTSLVLALVCILLFLCNYLLSYRSIALGVGRSVKISDKHGIPLC